MINSEQLSVIEYSDRKHLRYYHFNSVSNFIFHINNVPNQRDKEWIATAINDYLAYTAEAKIENIDESLKAWKQFLSPVAKYYANNLGFTLYMKPWIILINVLLFVAITYFLELPTLIFWIILLGLVCYVFYLWRKYKLRQLYAFLW